MLGESISTSTGPSSETPKDLDDTITDYIGGIFQSFQASRLMAHRPPYSRALKIDFLYGTGIYVTGRFELVLA